MHQRISKRAHHFGHLISKEANQAVSSGKELLITNRRVGLVINLIDGLDVRTPMTPCSATRRQPGVSQLTCLVNNLGHVNREHVL